MKISASDSAKDTDLVRCQLLHKLHAQRPKLRRGFYRDDALFLLEMTRPRQFEKCKKKLHKIVNSYGLKVVLEKQHPLVNYLDTYVNLFEGTCKPHHK